MTDQSGGLPEWAPILQALSRSAGHELRNALNALVVNLEVVRSRSDKLDPAIQPFMAQAVEQSEESVRLAEGTMALLALVLNAVGSGGALRITGNHPDGVLIASTESDSLLAVRSLQPLGARAGFIAEGRETSVILSISDKSQENKE